MLRKVFKTILVLTVCLGLTIHTNAAVSVSDGSAFVTKAEFAADLNNLSNRMAQLENSLDAKIDSLVSSYLTRNGIWNGATQTLKNYYILDFANPYSRAMSWFTPQTLTNGTAGFLGKTQSYSPTYVTKLSIPTTILNNTFEEVYTERGNYVIVESLNKSGLLYMTVNFAPSSVVWPVNTDKRCWINFNGEDYGTGTVQIEWNFEFALTGKTYFSRTNVVPHIQMTPSASWENHILGEQAYSYYAQTKVLTFVSKDDEVICRDYWLFKRNAQSGRLTETWGVPTDYWGIIMTIDECVVY